MQLDKIAIPYNVPARTVETDRDLYQSMVTRLKETDLTRSLDFMHVRVNAEPRVKTEPVGPKGQVIIETKVPGLSALPAGTHAANYSELMSAARLAKLLSDETFAGFERIIFDSAPVNAVSDALHLVKHATTICLVIRAGRTPVRAAQRASQGHRDRSQSRRGCPLQSVWLRLSAGSNAAPEREDGDPSVMSITPSLKPTCKKLLSKPGSPFKL